MQHSNLEHDSQTIQQDIQQPVPPRPPPFPLPAQRQPNRLQPRGQAGATPRNTFSGLLSNRDRAGNAPIPPSLQEKMIAMLNRGSSASPSSASFSPDSAAQRTDLDGVQRPLIHQTNLFPPPTISRGRGAAAASSAKRNKPSFKLSDINTDAAIGAANAGLGAGRPSVADAGRRTSSKFDTPFANFNKIVDPSGRLNFAGKAVIHASGVDFSNGSSFAINMEQLVLEHELGRGNYGTVKKVLHKPTKVAMAMKVRIRFSTPYVIQRPRSPSFFRLLQEIRLELDSTRLNGILMELDVLHRAVSPFIVEFYGAFFVESCVYYCMDLSSSPGSAWTSSPAPLADEHLGRIASSMTKGLAFLKDHLGVMHRDVKPTNVLVNRKGEIKLCDFGVSGQLEKSIARTNVGCQSYMAPERIKGSSPSSSNVDDAFTSYTVSADVWSLGLSIVEIARGKYPYPPETYENVFAQLSAIVDGEAPGLPDDDDDSSLTADVSENGDGRPAGRKWSPEARDWVRQCLIKNADERATYPGLLASIVSVVTK
ncbi:kinase-like protein [Boletus reticuloceps]|uniref:mitogen-activated protein kinase kinase n=1 Tax=Boletus reticuloceps TaxID=495285 RepID=A0A8I2YVR7_9AGAM|nr:kinase-like protein [Boletus reticuloceps]